MNKYEKIINNILVRGRVRRWIYIRAVTDIDIHIILKTKSILVVVDPGLTYEKDCFGFISSSTSLLLITEAFALYLELDRLRTGAFVMEAVPLNLELDRLSTGGGLLLLELVSLILLLFGSRTVSLLFEVAIFGLFEILS